VIAAALSGDNSGGNAQKRKAPPEAGLRFLSALSQPRSGRPGRATRACLRRGGQAINTMAGLGASW